MTLEEIEKKLSEVEDLHAELKTQLAELKAQNKEKPKPPHSLWKPDEGEYYYILMGGGTPSQWIWHADNDDGTCIKRYSIGNVFKTKEEAEFAVERLKVLAEMREWTGNWNDQYTICVDSCDGTNLYVFDRMFWTSGEMRFTTKEDAEGCIKAVGEERLKKYYFMVPEDEHDSN